MENERGERIFCIIKLVLSGILLILSLVLSIDNLVKMVLLIAAAIISGYEIALKSFKNLLKKEFFDENTLMLIAAITAFIIGEGVEGVIVIMLYNLGEFLEDLATDRSREKIAGLAGLKSFKANLMVDGKVVEVEPSEIKIGSLILVRKGDKVPIDGVIVKGSADFDLKALTGESKFYSKGEGEKIYSGAINLGDAVVVKTEKLYKDSTVEKIIEMVENSAERKAKSQRFITAFARVYTPCVVLFAVLISSTENPGEKVSEIAAETLAHYNKVANLRDNLLQEIIELEKNGASEDEIEDVYEAANVMLKEYDALPLHSPKVRKAIIRERLERNRARRQQNGN